VEPQRTGLVEQFLAVAEALRALPDPDILLDGEAMAHCRDGLPDFHGLRSQDGGAAACLFAFEHLRPLPLEERRARLRAAFSLCHSLLPS
jgi:ATP-dependent DNA ligase